MSRKHLDMSLLTCLDALIAERSVTRAASRLGMSQPGMSSALARLRHLTKDPLLVRTSRGMVLTPRGKELESLVKSGLAVLDEIFSDSGPFDPSQSADTVTVAASDSVVMLLGPTLRKLLDEHAPGMTLILKSLDPSRLRSWLVEGECDLAIGHVLQIPEEMHAIDLFSQSWCALVSANHPVIRKRMGLRQYLDTGHVLFGSAFSAVPLSESAIANTLRQMGHERKVGMRVTSIFSVPYVVADSSMVATLPAWFARHYASFLPVRLHKLPFDAPLIMNSMIWHDRTHHLGLHRWIRERVRQIVRDTTVSPHVGSGASGVRHFD